MTDPTPEQIEAEPLERWADIRDDPKAIAACGDRWEAVASAIGCKLHGFNDGRTASFATPDGNIIEVGPKFRAALQTLDTQGEVSQGDGLADELEYRANFGGMLGTFLIEPELTARILKALRSSTDQRSTSPKPRGLGE